jgi:hypothetical protein
MGSTIKIPSRWSPGKGWHEISGGPVDPPPAPKTPSASANTPRLPRIESVIETTDYEKVNAALAGGYVLLSVGTDPHGVHHYCLGVLAE